MIDVFEQKVLNTIRKHAMISPKDKVLVGFSGGPDSMALLYSLNRLKDLLNIRLYAMHINHQLRPKSADEDEKFCHQVCKTLSIPIKTCKINVRKYAQKNKLSIEESARELRYEHLLKTAQKLRCTKIALGHNADDNAETVILNLIRGTGLTGLVGIPPKRNNIVRPLIEISRNEILTYLKEYNLTYCQDLTNIELGYRRNYIRHKILPLFKEINPNLITTIYQTSELLRTCNEYINQVTQNALSDVLLGQTNQSIILDIEKLLSYNLFIRRQIIKTLIPNSEFKQIDAILNLTEDKTAGKRLKLSEDLWVWKEYDRLYFERSISKNRTLKTNHWLIDIGKVTKIKELGIEIMAKQKSIKNQKELTHLLNLIEQQPPVNLLRPMESSNNRSRIVLRQWFDMSAITLPLFIRFRQPGDRFLIQASQTKKLKDVLIDEKIPLRIRNQLPLLCDAQNILWIIGSRRAQIGLINKNTKNVLEVQVNMLPSQKLPAKRTAIKQFQKCQSLSPFSQDMLNEI
ncbi:MAG: tRNA lysidine(34) synthetase TilS [candidate division WOR-3 bacterium]